jgi:GNAT superfamily N-acetyltransferase
MDEIEAIERATLAAVPPQRLVQWQQWLLALDDGTVGRCHSAVPLRHEPPAAGALVEIERRYADAGLPAVLRVPELASFGPMRGELRARGYRRAKPTLVQVGRVAGLTAGGLRDSEVHVADSASADWEQVFLGEGFDPLDGASRLAILRRGRSSVFASVRQQERTVAVGAACFSEGWCGVHGMRTLPAQQGRGLATKVLAALGRAARERGVERCFLQVQQDNAAACSLYAARGFATAWAYAYWTKA